MRRRFFSNEKIDLSKNYLNIEALEDELTVSLSINECEYCVDNGSWIKLVPNTNTISINKGQTLYFRDNLTPTSNGIGTFTISKKCNLKGNIMSLLYGDNFEGKTDLTRKRFAFCELFRECTNIVDASELILPATTLAYGCYQYMFKGCSSLITAPELPATTLANSCYTYMFDGCTSLTKAPELPATTLAIACYQYMFKGCSSLITAPELPATTLANSCYTYMFDGCSKLSYIKMLATDISASSCLTNWVGSVASTGTFVKHTDMTSLPTGTNGIPEGWTVENYTV